MAIKFIPKSIPVNCPLKQSQKAFLSNITNIIAIICVTVFNFPQIDADITFPPFSTAINLYPETKNYLANTITGIHAGILSNSTNNTIAVNTNILSANGSKNFPNVVT